MWAEAVHGISVKSTDLDWYRFLRSRPDLREVNFWRPSGKGTTAVKGIPWLFLVRGTNQIWGCAFFSTFSKMSVELAWDTFGEANGFANLEQFRSKMAELKDAPQNRLTEIGCAVLDEPQYFSEPIDYTPYGRAYGGDVASFDVRSEDGARLWAQVAARIQAESPASPLVYPGLGKPIMVRSRIGQATFRIELEKQYQTRCAITGERTRPVLDAAHIKPFSLTKEHRISNGVLLRKDIHKLFDDGYVTITPDRRFVVSAAIREEFENGRDYYELDGRILRDTLTVDGRPAAEYLEWHTKNVFKG
jgi:putative restriction endonuclease